MTLALVPWLVLAQASQPADDLERQFRESIAADKAAAAPAAPPPQQPAQPIMTGALLNPEISVIGVFEVGARREPSGPSFRAGDDPQPSGFAVQELELSFAADVDPYFRMRTFLTMPSDGGIEIEEAFLEATSLPRGLGLKAGAFRSSFGRNNEQHLHVQDFARRPRTTELLGDDGLRGPGAQLSYLVPLDWYLSVFVEGFALDLGVDPSATFGIEQFFDLSRSWSLSWGLSAATLQHGAGSAGGPTPPREFLGGTDVYVRWRPPNEAETYSWVSLTAEYIASRTDERSAWDGVGYAQVVAQVARRIRAGLRLDLVGYPQAALDHEAVVSASLAFIPSEFSRVRLTYAHDADLDRSTSNDSLFLQLEGTIGAHGAHPF
jgi:hypothetical protein